MEISTYSANVGTEEEGRAWIGIPQPRQTGGVAVNEGMVKLLCGAAQDANPRYWEHGESPPSMLFTWVLGIPWTPQSSSRRPILPIKVPLPGSQVINVKQRVEFYAAVHLGDHLSMAETLIDISEQKRTALGLGHFVVTEGIVTRHDEVIVAKVTNTLFRYQVPDD